MGDAGFVRGVENLGAASLIGGSSKLVGGGLNKYVGEHGANPKKRENI